MLKLYTGIEACTSNPDPKSGRMEIYFAFYYVCLPQDLWQLLKKAKQKWRKKLKDTMITVFFCFLLPDTRGQQIEVGVQ